MNSSFYEISSGVLFVVGGPAKFNCSFSYYILESYIIPSVFKADAGLMAFCKIFV